MNILLTGVSGFVGSHIAEEFLLNGDTIYALKRKDSDLWRCREFADRINWIDCDEVEKVREAISSVAIDLFFHAAWSGVKAIDRDNWLVQSKNIEFLLHLLQIVKENGVKRVVAIGSQAEYGNYHGIVNEQYPTIPNSAYSAVKNSARQLLKEFCELNDMEWYWIRIFSVFGPKEDKSWLITSTINNLLSNRSMDLSPCDQRYDYLYIKEFTRAMMLLAASEENCSGIYNVSSGGSVELKTLLTYLEQKLTGRNSLLKFGALPYRPNQVMHMEGDATLFFNTFKFRPMLTLEQALDKTISYALHVQN